MTRQLKACALLVALLSASRLGAAEPGGGTHRWQQYQLDVPKTGWKVVGDALDDQGNKRLSLQTADESLVVLITLFAKGLAPDKQGLEKPAGAAVSFTLPLALKTASNDDSAIALSYGSVELHAGPAPLARFVVSAAGKGFTTIDGALSMDAQGASTYGVILLGKGVRGQVDTNGDHQRFVAEGYGIARSIRPAVP